MPALAFAQEKALIGDVIIEVKERVTGCSLVATAAVNTTEGTEENSRSYNK